MMWRIRETDDAVIVETMAGDTPSAKTMIMADGVSPAMVSRWGLEGLSDLYVHDREERTALRKGYSLWLAKILIYFRNSNLRRTFQISFSVKLRHVPPAAAPFRVTHSPVLFPPRTPLALRQQLAVLKSRNRRPRLSAPDRLFWVLARRCWAGWRKALIVVTPDTVVRWHRAGFRLYLDVAVAESSPGGPEADEQRAETAHLPNGC
jgi:hypothetical protein